jgi:para-nitrobenzyl esterase
MNTTHWRRVPLAAACCAALTALTLATAATAGAATAHAGSGGAPIVRTDDGAVQGMTAGTVNEFLGIPYAAPPTGDLRWRPPQPPTPWWGIRDATQFAPSCPQPPSPFAPAGPMSEDCLYLNVYTPGLPGEDGTHRLARGGHEDGRPVLVWIHGGGLTEEGSSNYDGAELAADGAIVVTINYRLGALGFLAHPALASRPGGPAGNYGLMDQQAALRWVQDNISRFGGNPHNVTIAGQSAGGLSVLAQLVSTGARGLFQKAIIESGAFALNQQPLATAEATGEAFAAQAGCPDQTAACLRNLPVSALAGAPFTGIPGVVDGKVLTEPIGTALAAGRFAHVPVLNGTNHDEERLFVDGLHLTVSGGTFAPIPGEPVTTDNYQANIAAVLGVSAARAAAIAAEYPPSAYPPTAFSSSADVALSALVGDANFACPALQLDQETAARVPTYAYEFNDDNAPQPYTPPTFITVATHESELPYLFGLPNAPFHPAFSPDQQTLAASMRAAWVNFAATGNPATAALPWPAFSAGSTQMLSLVPPQPQLETDFTTRHHCAFWAAG